MYQLLFWGLGLLGGAVVALCSVHILLHSRRRGNQSAVYMEDQTVTDTESDDFTSVDLESSDNRVQK